MDLTLNLTTFMAYLATALLAKAQVSRTSLGLKFAFHSIWTIALILHALLLATSLFTANGLDLAFFKAATTIMFIVSVTLFFSCLYKPLHLVAVWILLLTAVSILLILPGLSDNSRIVNADTLTIQLHIISSLLAYSSLIIAATLAILFHFQNQLLHQGQLTAPFRVLPPLEAAESFLFHLVTITLILLTVSLVSGWLYHENLFDQHLVHKTVLSFAAWLLLLILFVGRLLFGWREKKVVQFIITISILLILAYFGSKLVLEIILERV